MDDRDKNLTIKKSNLLHMDDYQNRDQTAKRKPRAKRPDQTGRRNDSDDKPEERPNAEDEKRPA